MGPSLLTLTWSCVAQSPPRPTTAEELPLDATESAEILRDTNLPTYHLQYKQKIQHRSNNDRPLHVDSNSTQDLPHPSSVVADYPTTMHKPRTSRISLMIGALKPRRSKRERKATTRFVEGWFGVRLPSLRWALQRVGRNGRRTALAMRGLSSP